MVFRVIKSNICQGKQKYVSQEEIVFLSRYKWWKSFFKCMQLKRLNKKIDLALNH